MRGLQHAFRFLRLKGGRLKAAKNPWVGGIPLGLSCIGRFFRSGAELGLEYWTKGDEVMKKSEGRVRLADYIQHLRQELTTAAKEGEGEELRFAVEEIEVELDVTMSQESTTEGGWDHWVVLKIGATDNKTISQKMRLKLKPLRGDAAKEAEKSGVTLLRGER